jgi:hypothetical protein
MRARCELFGKEAIHENDEEYEEERKRNSQSTA